VLGLSDNGRRCKCQGSSVSGEKDVELGLESELEPSEDTGRRRVVRSSREMEGFRCCSCLLGGVETSPFAPLYCDHRPVS
jgi:hypothetical protein